MFGKITDTNQGSKAKIFDSGVTKSQTFGVCHKKIKDT